MIDLALWAADTAYADRGNVLYLMPAQNQMDDFSQARFDRAIQDSPYLRSRLQPMPPERKAADSKRLKRIGPGWLYLRGSDSRRQVASVDADLVVADEFDQMREGTLELARRRVASSAAGLLRVASTPRYPETGVNGLFLQSDQRFYLLPCPRCGEEQRLTWPDSVDFNAAAVVCRSCHAPMDRFAQGRWTAVAPGNSRIRGYHLNRLYSPWANIPELIEASEATTPSALQEFHNSDLGEVFSPPGAGLTYDDLDRCRREYTLADYGGEPCVMGIDVGVVCHVVIRQRTPTWQWGKGARQPVVPETRLWYAGEVADFADLDRLWDRFHVERAVIDADPETRKATEWANRHEYEAWLARYSRHEPGHEFGSHERPLLCRANRTEAIDAMIELFRNETNTIPENARAIGKLSQGIGDYYRQLMAVQRRLEQDANGNWVARWNEGTKADHFAHAETYCALARESLSASPPFVWI